MKVVKTKLSELIRDTDNTRIHPRKSISAIKKSLSAFKQYSPIVVQKSSNKIIAGNGTHKAAEELGWEEIDCVFLDIDNDKARIISVVDNRTRELSVWNDEVLLKALYHMDESSQKVAGFFETDIAELFSSFESKDSDDITEKINLPDSTCPKCGAKFKSKDNIIS